MNKNAQLCRFALQRTIITTLLANVLMLTSCHQSAQKAGTGKQVDSTETSSIFSSLDIQGFRSA